MGESFPSPHNPAERQAENEQNQERKKSKGNRTITIDTGEG